MNNNNFIVICIRVIFNVFYSKRLVNVFVCVSLLSSLLVTWKDIKRKKTIKIHFKDTLIQAQFHEIQGRDELLLIKWKWKTKILQSVFTNSLYERVSGWFECCLMLNKNFLAVSWRE